MGMRSGLQTQLRFLNTNQRWWVRITENGKKTKVPERTIGEPHGRSDKSIFFEEYLNRPSLDLDVKLLQSVVQIAESFEEGPLCLGIPAEVIQVETQVREIFGKPIRWKVGSLGTRRGDPNPNDQSR